MSLRRWLGERIEWVIAGGFLVWWGILIVLRYYSGYENQQDLGTFAQSMWTTLHQGKLFFNSLEHGSTFGYHLSPVLFLVLPLYALVPHPLTLHALIVVSGSPACIVVYDRILRTMGIEERWPYLLILACNPPFHGVVFEGFYASSLVLLPCFLTWLFWRTNRPVPFVLTALFILMLRNDVALVLLGWSLFIGIDAWLKRKEGPPNGTWIGIALILPVIMVGYVTANAALQQTFPNYKSILRFNFTSYASSSDFRSVIPLMVLHPLVTLGNVFSPPKYLPWLEVLIPLAFLPLFRPRALLVVAPVILGWMVMDAAVKPQVNNHYAAVYPAFFMIALAESIQALKFRHRVVRVVLTVTIVCMLAFDQTPARASLARFPFLHARDAIVWDYRDQIPPLASVAVLPNFHPWFAHRPDDYPTPDWRAEWMVIDRKRQSLDFDPYWPEVLARYTVVSCRDEIYLLRRR